MEVKKFLEIVHFAEKLKNATRHCVTTNGRTESVAEHSWRISFMAILVADEFPEADLLKILKMCIIHDLGEAFTGDIPCFLKTDGDEEAESDVLIKWFKTFPEPYCTEFCKLLKEMEDLQTEEAKIYKALDNLEGVIQHNESDISTWLPLEYDLQFTYGEDKVKFSPYMTELKKQINKETKDKIEKESIKL